MAGVSELIEQLIAAAMLRRLKEGWVTHRQWFVMKWLLDGVECDDET